LVTRLLVSLLRVRLLRITGLWVTRLRVTRLLEVLLLRGLLRICGIDGRLARLAWRTHAHALARADLGEPGLGRAGESLRFSRADRGSFIGERVDGLLFVFLGAGRLVHERIQILPVPRDVYQAPLALAGHRIDVPLAEEADLIRALELLDGGRIFFPFPDVELNGAAVLLAALDQQLLFVALGLEGYARQLEIQADRDDG